MADINIHIPNGLLARALLAFDRTYVGRPVGTSQAEWAMQHLRQYVRGIIIADSVAQTDPYVDNARDQAEIDRNVIVVS